MDIPSLQRQISTLEASIDSLEKWLALMTALVVLGLILEYIPEIPEEFRRFRRERALKPLFIMAGAILITVGVAGELAVQFRAGTEQTALRQANDSVFTALNTEAATARAEASKASERAAQNEKEAAELRKIAADEQLARTRLEAEIQPRTLSLKQQQDLADACKPFPGHGVELFSYVGDAEGARLGGMIKAALLKGKMIVSDRRNGVQMVNAPEPEGVDTRISTRRRSCPPRTFNDLAVLRSLLTKVDTSAIRLLRDNGASWPEIARQTGLARATCQKALLAY